MILSTIVLKFSHDIIKHSVKNSLMILSTIVLKFSHDIIKHSVKNSLMILPSIFRNNYLTIQEH